MLKAAFAPSRTILPDDYPDRHGVGDVDEESRHERQDDEGPRASPVKLRYRSHVRYGGRRRAERDACKSRSDHRRLVVPAHHWKGGEHSIGDPRHGLEGQHEDKRETEAAEGPVQTTNSGNLTPISLTSSSRAKPIRMTILRMSSVRRRVMWLMSSANLSAGSSGTPTTGSGVEGPAKR